MRLSFEPPRDLADYPFRHPIRVRFAETDAMGVVHHAAYLPYLEETRVAYLRHIGHPYVTMQAEGIDFAVLEAAVQYLRPLRFDDVVEVAMMVGSVTRTTFQVGYLLAVDGVTHATAVTVHGSVDSTGRAVRTPSSIMDAIRPE